MTDMSGAMRLLTHMSASDCSLPREHNGRIIRPHRMVSCNAQTAAKCPFAGSSKFAIASPPPGARTKPTPLDSQDQPFSAPADVFLAGGSSGQNVPGKLVAGISRLYDVGIRELS